jgi:hypothetical protein
MLPLSPQSSFWARLAEFAGLIGGEPMIVGVLAMGVRVLAPVCPRTILRFLCAIQKDHLRYAAWRRVLHRAAGARPAPL